MHTVGIKVDNFKFPVCNIFKPRNLFGQLCYKMDVEIAMKNVKLNSGPINGLTLTLDYNEERNIAGQSEKEVKLRDAQKSLLDFENKADTRFSARIYIDTLEPYTGNFFVF